MGAVISLRCSAGHVVTSPPTGVQVTHARGIVLGYEVWCTECAAYDSVVAEPERIALLLEFGVGLSPFPSEAVLPIMSDQRRIVSAKYLLDDKAIAELTQLSDPEEVLEHP